MDVITKQDDKHFMGYCFIVCNKRPKRTFTLEELHCSQEGNYYTLWREKLLKEIRSLFLQSWV